jgi:hypothetical protein
MTSATDPGAEPPPADLGERAHERDAFGRVVRPGLEHRAAEKAAARHWPVVAVSAEPSQRIEDQCGDLARARRRAAPLKGVTDVPDYFVTDVLTVQLLHGA